MEDYKNDNGQWSLLSELAQERGFACVEDMIEADKEDSYILEELERMGN